MLAEIIIKYLPVIILLILGFSIWNRKKLFPFRFHTSLLLSLVMILSIVALPNDYSIDKPRYISLFYDNDYWDTPEEYKDPGWIVYVNYCSKYLKNVTWFFLLTASIYIFSYLVFARYYFEKNAFYFIVMSMGCLGFFAYATNTIRAGFAIAFLLLSLTPKKKIFMLPLMFCAVMLHRSMIIPVVGYWLAVFLPKNWVYYSIWVLCLIFSIMNVDIETFVDSFGFIDYRVERTWDSIELYKKEFRWDFLLYSVIPLLISIYNIHRHNIQDKILFRMINMYLFVNSIWLLAIRIHYSDRLAYLSWFLIPFITLYPITKYQEKYINPNRMLIVVMGIFIGINIVLMSF